MAFTWTHLKALGLFSVLPLAACAPDNPQPPAVDETTTVDGTAIVSLQEAEKIAVDAVGEGRVTWSGPEDDRGAAWEIEVTRPNGREVDVLIAPDGTVLD